MRYRRVNHRYSVMVSGSSPGTFWLMWRSPSPGMVARPGWRPSTDIYETSSALAIIVELAGVEQDELEVLLFEDALVVEGRRQLPACEAGAVYHVAEIAQGPFRLEIPLPSSVGSEVTEARYERGLLTIMLPKNGTRS